MSRKFRIAAVVFAVLAAIVVATLVGTYAALHRVRPFYEQALAIEPQALEQGSREMESRATALYNDARRDGQWQAAFTAEQINGWLALQLEDFYGDGAKSVVIDPRVAIENGVFTLGFRARHGGVDTVVSADTNLSVTEEGDVAIRLISVKAGAVPLPVMQLADQLSRACQQLALPVRWTQDAGQPIALVDVGDDLSNDGRRITLEAAELRDGTLYIAGRTDSDVAE